MKRILLLLFLMSCFSFRSTSQDINTPAAIPVSGGVLVYCGNQIPKNGSYVIERRKNESGRYENTGTAKAPASVQEMEQRQVKYSTFFKALDPINSVEQRRIWSYLQSHVFIDSISADNLPMLHLMAGTAFFDNTAEKGVNYQYRVSKTDASGKQISQQVTNSVLSFKMPQLPKMYFSQKKYADGKLAITWALKDQLGLSHFNIYRTIFGKDDYQKIQVEKGVYGDKDSLKLLAIDSIGKSPGWFEYKITPVDLYGNEGEEQGYVDGNNIQDYYAPPVSRFKAVNTGSNHEVRLSWSYENKKYLNGISVMRSTNYDSGYIRIATVPLSDTTFTDILPVSGENYYYYLLLSSAENRPIPTAKVFAVYTDKNEVPERPDKIDAVTIPEGIHVYWTSDAPYTKGFYVYRRSDPTQSFVQVSSLIPVGTRVYSFADTTNLLQPGNVYEYVVRAMSENNLLSDNSDTVSAHPGKKMVLVPPMNVRFNRRDGKTTVLWDDMTPLTENLLGYRVLRKEDNGAWIAVANDSVQPKKNFFVDSVNNNKGFSYAVSSLDYFGNVSQPSVIAVPAERAVLPSAPSGIKISQTSEGVYISWGQISNDIGTIKIYRSESGQKAELIGSTNENDFFEDKKVGKGKLYFYQISSVDVSKREGNLSEKVSVRVK